MSCVFPAVVNLDVGQSITLFADGTLIGDPVQLEMWLIKLRRGDTVPDVGSIATVMFWLLQRAMQDDRHIARAPRVAGQGRR